MKKIWLYAALSLAALGTAFGGTITVTQPAAGSVAMGSTVQIAWTAVDVSSHVRIRLVQADGTLAQLLEDDRAPGGSPFPWTVASPAVVGGSYRIQVRALDNSARGESANFTVTAAGPGTTGAIRDVRLSGSPPYAAGSSVTISWSLTGVSQPLKLQLLRGDGGMAGAIANNLSSAATSHPWLAGNLVGGAAGAGDYKVRVSTVDDSLSADSPLFALAGSSPVIPAHAVIPDCDLELAGVGVEYYNGNVVAWVKNNGPDALNQDVKFLLDFPERGGGGHYVTRRLTIPVGQERSVELQAMAPGDIPDSGLRTIVSIETSRSAINDPNRLNQHRDVRLWAEGHSPVDLALTLNSHDVHVTRVVGGGTLTHYRYRLRATLRLRNNSPAPAAIHEVTCSWTHQYPSSLDPAQWVQAAGTTPGSIRVGPFRPGEWTTCEITIEFLIHHNWVDHDNRILFELDPEHRFNDPDRGNNRAATGAFRD
jgi:hypothetical protein